MKRRNFLRHIISTSVLSLGGISAFQYYQQSQLQNIDVKNMNFQFLNNDDLIVLEVLIPVFVNQLTANHASILTILQNIDSTIIRLPVKTQTELRELFDLLSSALGRLAMANVWLNWQMASKNSINEFLTEWRNSHLDLLKVAYKGLHKIIVGSSYAEASTWQAIGYAGPPVISLN